MRPFRRRFFPPLCTNASLRAAKRIIRTGCCPRCASGSAVTWRRPPASSLRNETTMSDSHSDALVFFGATGDLAYKKIFPALQAMVKRGHLNVPVIGVAKSGWNLDQLRARAHDSVEKHGGLDPAAFEKLSWTCCVTWTATTPIPQLFRRSGRNSTARRTAGVLPRHSAAAVRDGGRTTGESGCAKGARVIVEKPFGHDLASARELNSHLASGLPRIVDLSHRPLSWASGR